MLFAHKIIQYMHAGITANLLYALRGISIYRPVYVLLNNLVGKAQAINRQSAEAHGMDITTPFFKNLPYIVENVSNPLSALGMAYRQQACLQKLPYVVSLALITSYRPVHKIDLCTSL